MASIIHRGSVRNNVHGNFRCINKKPPVPKQKMVFAEHPIEVAVEPQIENQPIPVEDQPNIEAPVENSSEPKLESWKAKREKKKLTKVE